MSKQTHEQASVNKMILPEKDTQAKLFENLYFFLFQKLCLHYQSAVVSVYVCWQAMLAFITQLNSKSE